jgi:hypothetical protein
MQAKTSASNQSHSKGIGLYYFGITGRKKKTTMPRKINNLSGKLAQDSRPCILLNHLIFMIK